MVIIQKMINNFLALLLFSILTVQTPAQQPELDKLIDALQGRYQRISSLSADFIQTYTSRSDRPRRESGHVVLRKPGKMRWDYLTPEKKLFLSDGKNFYEYAPADGYATKTPVKESDDLRAPFMFLLGRGNLRKEFNKIEFAKESPARAGNKVLRLLPRRAQDFKELIVEFDPLSLQISRLTLIESDGSRSDFLFSNINENGAVSDSSFVFKPPAGVEVRN